MSQGNGSSTRFVPSGVDAQSWLGFEHRIQERRFKALLDAITTAVAARDGIAARIALEEARELRPDAPELQALSARIALLPTASTASGPAEAGWYRGLSAVALFVVGVGFVIGIESYRSNPEGATPVAVVASAEHTTGEAAPVATPVARPSAPAAASAVATATGSPDADDSAAAPLDARRPVAEPKTSEIKREEPVSTAGVSRAIVPGAPTAAVPNRSTFRPAVPEAVEGILPAGREVPDDYVAPSPRSESYPGYTEVPAASAALAANVMPQPISITAPPATTLPATNTVVATTAAIAPRSDNTRVAQVLNQYARAYGRLDPGAARAVWPTVDERALARAFASLESQEVSFDTCDIDVKGATASASCRGTASYVGKVGSRQARTEARLWIFELKLQGDDWKIEKAQASTR